MRRYKKREMLEVINMLLNVNDFIVKNYKINKKEDIINTLAKCQDVALELGNYFETLGESEKLFVPVLEGYCENLYQMGRNLAKGNMCKQISEQIKSQLSSLKNDILSEIPVDRIEMVFLPYKASMWDSLESVWKAATEDPDCDAYVVPIPYFEKNAAGELAVEHYEGEQFPEYVPVVHYKNYAMADRRPDVAFIHNPYDQYNYVTSIHPAYYISELKKYADKVAYIPYYVSAEANPDAEEIQKQKEGFILTPGVLHSDFVFVQSENMKKLYVNVLEKNVSGVGKAYWENKIFGLGSPKLDRVHNTKRDDNRLCKEWKSLIFDEQGKRKKVILYNTSIGDLLKHENMLEKIGDTLAFFEKNREYTLWWRPHPLYESTIVSMRPELLGTYKETVKKYKSEGWGVFDEGEDLEWAIAETDAYYGDGSSVVQLYLEAGRPVLYQDPRVRNYVKTEMDIPIWPCAFYVDGDDIWFVHGKINLLMKYNMKIQENIVIGKIPGEVIFQETLYESMYKYKNLIYLIPCWARKISVYDLDSQKFDFIELKSQKKYQNQLLFKNAYSYGKYLYCIPYYYQAIVKLDMEYGRIEYIEFDYLDESYISASVRFDNQIIATWNESNYLLILDLETDELLLKECGGKQRKYTKICQNRQELYLYDNCNGELLKTNKNFDKMELMWKCPEHNFFMYVLQDKLIINFANKRPKIKINLLNKEITEVSLVNNIPDMVLHPTYKTAILESGKNTINYLFDCDKNKWIQYENEEINKEFAIEMKESKSIIKNTIIKNISIQLLMCENEILDLMLWTCKAGKIKCKSEIQYRAVGEIVKECVKSFLGS